jgi:hypothetical protein
MALFKCLQSGNTVEFVNEWDIAQIKAHPDYVEVIEEVKPVVVKKSTITTSKED